MFLIATLQQPSLSIAVNTVQTVKNFNDSNVIRFKCKRIKIRSSKYELNSFRFTFRLCMSVINVKENTLTS